MRALMRLVLLLAVLGTVGWFCARWIVGSSWGRASVERRFGRALEMDVAVGDVRLEWPGVVVAENVSARFSTDKDTPADITVKEVCSSLCGRRITLRRPMVTLVQGVARDWQPSVLRGLADAKPLEDVLDSVAQGVGTARCYDVANATVLSRLADGTEKPLFGGLSWSMRKVSMEGHNRVTHHRVTVQTRGGVPAGADGPLTLEWLSEPRCPPIKLWDVTGASATPSPAGPAPAVENEPAATAAQDAPCCPPPVDLEAPVVIGGDPAAAQRPDPKGEL